MCLLAVVYNLRPKLLLDMTIGISCYASEPESSLIMLSTSLSIMIMCLPAYHQLTNTDIFTGALAQQDAIVVASADAGATLGE